MTAIEALLARLVDDAGQFPPARKPLEQAVADHGEARSGPWSWMLGRFLCPASKLEPDLPQPLGVIADGDDWRIDLDAAVAAGADCFEIRDPGPDAWPTLAAAPLAVFIEAPRSIDALGEQRLGAKIRCGGVIPEAFPSDAAVAGFIGDCKRTGVPFKATAGLHHPFRTRDEQIGVLQHGFVNLLAATVLDVDPQPVIAAPAEELSIGPDGLRWRDRFADAEAVARGRQLFTAFGSCSFTEPVEDLRAAGVLESARA